MKNLVRITIITLALGLAIWTVAVTLSPIASNFSAGDEVSAATFNNLFTAINDNFVALDDGKVETAGDTITGNLGVGGDLILTPTAVFSEEIENEAGAANIHTDTSFTLTGGVDVLLSRTITVPTDGYVIAMATCDCFAGKTTATDIFANYGVNDSDASIPITQDFLHWVDSSLPNGIYYQTFTVQGLFTVTAGSHTFYFLGDQATGDGEFIAFDRQLTLIFVPTSYGTIQSNLVGSTTADGQHGEQLRALSPALEASTAAERAESIAADQDRIERELAEMRRRMDELQDELDRMQ